LVDVTLVLSHLFMVTTWYTKNIVLGCSHLDLPKPVKDTKCRACSPSCWPADGPRADDAQKTFPSDDAISRKPKEQHAKIPELRRGHQSDNAVTHGRVIHVLDLLQAKPTSTKTRQPRREARATALPAGGGTPKNNGDALVHERSRAGTAPCRSAQVPLITGPMRSRTCSATGPTWTWVAVVAVVAALLVYGAAGVRAGPLIDPLLISGPADGMQTRKPHPRRASRIKHVEGKPRLLRRSTSPKKTSSRKKCRHQQTGREQSYEDLSRFRADSAAASQVADGRTTTRSTFTGDRS